MDEFVADTGIDEETEYEIEYRCPRCKYEWTERYSCACDSECPQCGLKNITALDYGAIDSELP